MSTKFFNSDKTALRKSDAAVKKEANRRRSQAESRGGVYLPCFGLVLHRLFGLFLGHRNVVH